MPLLGWIAAIVATAFVVRYWDEIISIATSFIQQIASQWNLYVDDILNGAWESVIQRFSQDIAVVAQRYYFRGNNGKFYRESICEEIPLNEIPFELQEKVMTQEAVDVTARMK
ncbi:MAG: hypothetical protein MJ048_06065, partial [Acidaminococcaceae bacterium]|nr:hypothetical protein [Acidaminococcaceae bacterium]